MNVTTNSKTNFLEASPNTRSPSTGATAIKFIIEGEVIEGRVTAKQPAIIIDGLNVELTPDINLTKSKHKILIDNTYYIREIF